MKSLLNILHSFWAYFVFIVFTIIGVVWYLGVILIWRGTNVDALYIYNHFWGNAFAFLTGVKTNIIGAENFKSNSAYIIVGNHTSNADLPVAAASFSIRYRVLGKVEVNDIPILGFIFKNALVSVDRRNPQSRAASVLKIKKLLNDGVSVLIFPEGTRNRSSLPLKSFYDGAFRIAIETQTPIMPWVVVGAKQIQSIGDWKVKPGTMHSHFFKPIDTTGLTLNDLPKLKEQVFTFMWDKLIELDPAFVQLKDENRQTAELYAQINTQKQPKTENNLNERNP